MSATSRAAIAYGRRRAEEEMVDACVIRRGSTDEWTIDPDTGYEVPAGPDTVYEGRCKLQSFVPHESTPDVGGQTVTIQRTMLHLPAGIAPVRPGDDVEMTASINGLTGRKYRISYDGPYKTWATATRVYVDEVS